MRACSCCRGRIGALPSGLLFSYGILAASLFVGFSGGVRTPAIYSLPILIGLSAWLTAPRHAVIITLIAMAGTFGLTVAEVNGALNPRGPLPPYAAWFALVALLIIAAILAIIVKRAFQLQLDQLNSLSEALSRQVEELDAEKSQLRLVAENVPVMRFSWRQGQTLSLRQSQLCGVLRCRAGEPDRQDRARDSRQTSLCEIGLQSGSGAGGRAAGVPRGAHILGRRGADARCRSGAGIR
ncbi:MAG: hypothetical protein M5R42_02135 [Rhodocyclaceae bacterium]|nr:hypothetical protein [Rhodocyclaceae bacterium]